jgi:hypothetical protein
MLAPASRERAEEEAPEMTVLTCTQRVSQPSVAAASHAL